MDFMNFLLYKLISLDTVFLLYILFNIDEYVKENQLFKAEEITDFFGCLINPL